MNSEMIACLAICILMITGYISGKVSMGAVAMLGVALFRLTNCISAENAVSYFGNSNAIIVVCMFILSAGLTRTQMIHNLTSAINRAAKGSIRKVFFGYAMLVLILDQFIGWGIAEFSIVAPLLGIAADQLGVRRSKVMYPLVTVCIVGMGWIPIGPGLANISFFNGMIESFSITGYKAELFDLMLVRLAGVILTVIYSVFVGLRISPDEPSSSITVAESSTGGEAEKLPVFQEICGYVIFFGTCVALIIAAVTGLYDGYIACVVGAALMVFTGVLSGKQALNAFPLSFYCIFTGALAMGGALSNTGAADLIGQIVADVIGSGQSTFIVYLVFFLLPFILTQFMMNAAVLYSFAPVILSSCKVMALNPVGPLVLLYTACTTAFMTPMACPPMTAAMTAGGYDFKSIFRQSIGPSIIVSACGIISACILFPLY
ncbi:MAG: SLC13 family permease [Lachnospiraceae bacterium]|nr:SLC13 family permease [Lachnospiraceae bacterium]